MAELKAKATSVATTSGYGWRVLKTSGIRNFHEGYDTATGGEYPHSAYASGVVTKSPQVTKDSVKGWYIQYGIPGVIEISHHSLRAPARFKVGDRVNMGDIIGYAGKSALAASGNHVHNGLWLGGKHVDPLQYLKPGQTVTISYGGTTAGGASTPITSSTAAVAAARRRRAIFMYSLYWTGPTSANVRVYGRILLPHGSFHVPNPQIFGLLERRRNAAINGDTESEKMLDAEHDIINSFLVSTVRSAHTGIALDANKFNIALTEAFAKLGKDLVVDFTTGQEGNEIDAAELAAAFDLAVPRIVNSMIKQQGEALTASSAANSAAE